MVAYQTRSLAGAVGRRFGRLARVDDPFAAEPWRSLWLPDAMARILGRYGIGVREDRSLLEIAAGIDSPTARRRLLGNGRVAVAERMGAGAPRGR